MSKAVKPTVREADEDGNIQENTDARSEVFFHPQEWDLKEELQGTDAFRESAPDCN